MGKFFLVILIVLLSTTILCFAFNIQPAGYVVGFFFISIAMGVSRVYSASDERQKPSNL